MKKKEKIGNIYMIPLPNGKYAFGRMFHEGVLGIYKEILGSDIELPKTEEYIFYVCVYASSIRKLKCVDFRPFVSDDESWAPPTRIVDSFTGNCSIYYKGQITPSTRKACEFLEDAAVWETPHIVDRIMGNRTWQDILGDRWNATSHLVDD